MRKSKEQIRIEAALQPLEARRAVILADIDKLRAEDARLADKEQMLMGLLGKDTTEQPPAAATPPKAKRGRKGRASVTIVTETAPPKSTHRCPEHGEVVATVHRGIAMCPKCESIEIEPLEAK